MARYIPLSYGNVFDASASNLESLSLRYESLTALFFLPDAETRLQVQMESVQATRTIDEMPFSTEDSEDDHDGLVPHGFAYEVVNGYFWRCQSQVWLGHLVVPLRQFTFITGWTCLDVIAKEPPIISRVSGGDAHMSPASPKPTSFQVGEVDLIGYGLGVADKVGSRPHVAETDKKRKPRRWFRKLAPWRAC